MVLYSAFMAVKADPIKEFMAILSYHTAERSFCYISSKINFH